MVITPVRAIVALTTVSPSLTTKLFSVNVRASPSYVLDRLSPLALSVTPSIAPSVTVTSSSPSSRTVSVPFTTVML